MSLWVRRTRDAVGELVETVRLPRGRRIKVDRAQLEKLLVEAGYRREA